MAPAPFRVPTGSPVIENTDETEGAASAAHLVLQLAEALFHLSVPLHPRRDPERDAAPLLRRGGARQSPHRGFPPPLLRGAEGTVPLPSSGGANVSKRRWESDGELPAKLPDQAVRKAIVQSHLADIAAWEKETGRPLLFSDEVTAAELELTAPFGGGRYQLKGRIDRLQR